MNGAKAAADADLQLFAAAVAHEIRTPLTALSGEIEVALRRDRSAEEYREVLRRIAAPLSDLVAISSDLTLLSDPVDRSITGSRAARLDAILGRLHDRFRGNRAMQIDALPAAHVQVAGDEQRLSRAITLIIEHACAIQNQFLILRRAACWIRKRVLRSASCSGSLGPGWRGTLCVSVFR